MENTFDPMNSMFDDVVSKHAADYEIADRGAVEPLMPKIKSKYVGKLIESLNKLTPAFGIAEPLPASNSFTYESFTILNMVSNAVKDAVSNGILDEDHIFNPASLKTDQSLMVAVGNIEELSTNSNFMTWLKSPRTDALPEGAPGHEERETPEEENVEEKEMPEEEYMEMLSSKKVR